MQSKSVAIVVMLLFFVIPVSAQFNHKGDSLLRFTNRGIWDGKRGGAVTKKGDVSKKATPAKKAVIKKDAAKAVKSSAAKKRSVRNDSVVYAVRYSLGDRVIMRGDSGADVRCRACGRYGP